jgi:3-hydroxyacyl-[acyl-carrier-protein] dehydratase
VQLDIRKILTILPHRYPFLMVDRVTSVTAGQVIRGYKNVSINEPYFNGHFPSDPIMPGVLIIEALTQIGGILAYVTDPFDAQGSLMYFLGIDKAKFRHPVRPGDRLDLEVKIVGHHSNVWRLKGEATVDGTLCAEGQMLASVVEKP